MHRSFVILLDHTCIYTAYGSAAVTGNQQCLLRLHQDDGTELTAITHQVRALSPPVVIIALIATSR